MTHFIVEVFSRHRKKYFQFIFFSLLLLFFSSCYQQKFLKHFDEVSMHSTQWILEAQGDTVPFTMQVQVPRGLLRGNMDLYVTPYLKQDSMKTPFSLFNSPEGASPEAIIISGSKGGDFLITGYFMNFKQFQNSLFVAEWHADFKGKTAPLPERLLGYGISQLMHDAQKISPIKPGFNPAIIREKLGSVRSDDALLPYLQAVMSARLYDANAVKIFLETAFSKTPSLKEKARVDVEFIGYRKEGWFQALLQ